VAAGAPFSWPDRRTALPSIATTAAGTPAIAAAQATNLPDWRGSRRPLTSLNKATASANAAPSIAVSSMIVPAWQIKDCHSFSSFAACHALLHPSPWVFGPLGVVTCIVPWNSPLLLTTMKLAALAAGNTVVTKPSEFASTSLIAFARLFEKAGFPPGMVNVVTGYGKEVGEVLTTHPLVKRIAFTGGKAVAAAAAQSFKRVSLELGGKSPNIVLADANQAAAVKGVVSGIFAATGQTCMPGSRLPVHSSIHDEFVGKLAEFVSAARLGDPAESDTNMGPVSNRPQLERVMKHRGR